MKLYGIAWDLASTDGERLLSIWTKPELAVKELSSLLDESFSKTKFRIVEIESDKRDGVEDALDIDMIYNGEEF